MTGRILDANIFIQAVGRQVPFDQVMTVPAVVDELESRDAASRYGLSSVDVYEPGREAVDRVEEVAGRMEEDLSDADVQVLALALERGATVVTDDYGVQNVAERLDIEYEGLHQEEIEEEVEWKRVCSSCGAGVEGSQCERCGGEPERVRADG